MSLFALNTIIRIRVAAGMQNVTGIEGGWQRMIPVRPRDLQPSRHVTGKPDSACLPMSGDPGTRLRVASSLTMPLERCLEVTMHGVPSGFRVPLSYCLEYGDVLLERERDRVRQEKDLGQSARQLASDHRDQIDEEVVS